MPALKVTVVTALRVEFAAVTRSLSNAERSFLFEPTLHFTKGSYFVHHNDVNERVTVSVFELGVGNVNAATYLPHILAKTRPQLLVLLGVAGGLKDVRVGDVVVADIVYLLESGKITGEGFNVRPRQVNCSQNLVQIARSVYHSDDWHSRILDGGEPLAPQAFVGPIVSGDIVLADAESDMRKRITRLQNDALAIEMEGYGVMLAHERHAAGVESLVIRGVSDLLAGKAISDAKGSQERASRAAVGFFCSVLERYCAHESVRTAGVATELEVLVSLKVKVKDMTPDLARVFKVILDMGIPLSIDPRTADSTADGA